MISVPYVFGDNALFQHSSNLEIRGNAEKCVTITVKLNKSECILGEWSCKSDENGVFSVSIETPVASYDFYDLSIECGDEVKVIKNLLFGELWLACGQSNM